MGDPLFTKMYPYCSVLDVYTCTACSLKITKLKIIFLNMYEILNQVKLLSAGYPLEFYTFIWVPICMYVMYTFGIQTTRHIYLCTCTTVDMCFLIISELLVLVRTRHLNEIFSSTKLFQAFRAVPKIGSIFTTNFSKR